ncbi:head maturation protease [Mycobacterium phage SirPhilip]|uniref:MuF-like minor capsid protein n=1 Tax=Mycobacterium phage SirPhilip TaxID=2015824 RepID=A0A222ZM14_9CAUD|nr:head maturation protease [Mycobacterium phage SirPhilip]ASR85211.1 MuF-like minor capsid protein [Mycobacterium phage SirPhilip]
MTTAVREFQGVLSELAGRVGGAIDTLMPHLADVSQRDGMALITDAYPALVDRFLGPAGDLTAQWYAEQPGGIEGFVAEPAALPEPSQLAANGRWALLQKDPARAMRGSSTRAVFNQSRRTVLDNAEREGVRWVRHAAPNACGFCRMLATRVLTMDDEAAPGLYRTKYNALHPHSDKLDAAGHDHCKCVAVALRDGRAYEAPDYVHDWLVDYQAVARTDDGYLRSPGAIAYAMEARGKERTRLHQVGQWLDAEDEHRHAVAYWEAVDAELNRIFEPEAEPIEAPNPKGRKPKRTLDDVEVELNAAMEVGDEALIDKLVDEMDKIEAREKAAAERQAVKEAAKLAEDQAKVDRMLDLIEREGYDPVEAESEVYGRSVESIRRRDFIAEMRREGHTGKSFDEMVMWKHHELATEAFRAAEDATNGVMMKKRYGSGGLKIDPARLWTENETTARKWMSEEMAEWFDQHGRVTRQSIKAAVLAGRNVFHQDASMVRDFLQ